jgi:bacillithiol synthase
VLSNSYYFYHMLFTAQHIPYRQTNKFSKIVLDYIDAEEGLQSFYALAPTIDGLQQAIATKEKHKVDRATLVNALQEQYSATITTNAVKSNIEALLHTNTFTICTAHQPNLFSGPLYYIYKILHTIKLAQQLKNEFEGYHFVPVFYIGSEDADKEELNHTYVQGKKYEWTTSQTGAFGHMKIDAALVQLIDEMAGQLTVLPHGQEVIDLLKQCYQLGTDIKTATFELVNALFGKYGLVVLIPEHPELKRSMQAVFEDDLFHQQPSLIVEAADAGLGKAYNLQAHPRAINTFYLKDNVRERIVKVGEQYAVHNTDIIYSAEALKKELEQYPERFSPNVILRGLYQETILPNIAFLGGGGELAYWLQLKALFEHYSIPYPVLVLRNSFLVIEKKWQQAINKLELTTEQLFQPELDLLNVLLEKMGKKPQLDGEVDQLSALYTILKAKTTTIDATLNLHVEALKVKALNQLLNLEKKMQRAERKKHEALKNQIAAIKRELFPKNGLQERVENFSSFYAKWGSGFIDDLLQHSLSLEQQFTVLTEA